jgi:hypothetical protein
MEIILKKKKTSYILHQGKTIRVRIVLFFCNKPVIMGLGT